MNLLTFDIEEWFHCDFISGMKNWSNYEVRIYENTDFILKTLSKYNRKATFFILGWVADKHPDIVKKIYAEGHEIGCHSMKHELVHRFNPQQFKEDTQNALNVIEQVIGEKVIMYRAPAFSITKDTPWAFEILNELGITHDASVFPAKHDYGGFPSFGNSEPSIIETNGVFIKEFPINTLKIFQITNLTRTIKALQDNGLWVIGLDGKAETVIYDVNLSEATAIVMGAEGKGIRQLIKKTCDQLVSIPMIGSVQSLNVSVATGVALFESKRQRKTS